MDEKTVTAYLDRIAVARPDVLDPAALRALHRAHQLTVPFENLSIHLSEPISLDEDKLLDKIVTRRRGGFCYELNGPSRCCCGPSAPMSSWSPPACMARTASGRRSTTWPWWYTQ